jgi:hypothetical protein
MRAEVAMQALAHAAVTVDHVTQRASNFIAHRTAKAAASGEIVPIGHVGSVKADKAANQRSFGVGRRRTATGCQAIVMRFFGFK